MTDPVKHLAIAEAEATLARERLAATLAKLQVRLNPRRVARQASRRITDTGTALVHTGTDTAQHNPAALAGIVALAGLFLGRHRLRSLYRHIRGATDRR